MSFNNTFLSLTFNFNNEVSSTNNSIIFFVLIGIYLGINYFLMERTKKI